MSQTFQMKISLWSIKEKERKKVFQIQIINDFSIKLTYFIEITKSNKKNKNEKVSFFEKLLNFLVKKKKKKAVKNDLKPKLITSKVKGWVTPPERYPWKIFLFFEVSVRRDRFEVNGAVVTSLVVTSARNTRKRSNSFKVLWGPNHRLSCLHDAGNGVPRLNFPPSSFYHLAERKFRVSVYWFLSFIVCYFNLSFFFIYLFIQIYKRQPFDYLCLT